MFEQKMVKFSLVFAVIGVLILGFAVVSHFDDLTSEVALLMMAFGSFFTLFGSAYPVIYFRRRATEKALKQNGKRVRAQIVGISRNESININGFSPWVIDCQWLDTTANQVHIFRSGSIDFDPASFVEVGAEIGVLLNPSNPKQYFVDLSTLPTAV